MLVEFGNAIRKQSTQKTLTKFLNIFVKKVLDLNDPDLPIEYGEKDISINTSGIEKETDAVNCVNYF